MYKPFNCDTHNWFLYVLYSYLCCPAVGVAGNLVAVQASRISTYLHMNGLPIPEPNPAPQKCPTPCSTFFGSGKGNQL